MCLILNITYSLPLTGKEREEAHKRLTKRTHKQKEELNDQHPDDEDAETYEESRRKLVEMIYKRDGERYDDLDLEELQETWDDPDANKEESTELDNASDHENQHPYPNVKSGGSAEQVLIKEYNRFEKKSQALKCQRKARK